MKKFFLFVLFLLVSATLVPQSSHLGVKPLIGISCSHPQSDYSSVRRTYTEAVLKTGGLPVLIPIMESEENLMRIVSLLDGLILTGGEDVHPRYYNEEPIEGLGEVNEVRDYYDLTLIRLAAERKLPTLGICRGEQLINVAFGGSLYQDMPTQFQQLHKQVEDTTIYSSNLIVEHNQSDLSKYPTHYITLLPGSIIAEITGATELVTNTHHHQAVKQVAPGFRITAWACDSIPEAIESCNGLPMWGVQFHPESPTMHGDTVMIKFFEFLNQQAMLYRSHRLTQSVEH